MEKCWKWCYESITIWLYQSATPKKPSKKGSKLKSNLGVRLCTDKKKNVVEALNDVNKEGVSNNVVENA